MELPKKMFGTSIGRSIEAIAGQKKNEIITNERLTQAFQPFSTVGPGTRVDRI